MRQLPTVISATRLRFAAVLVTWNILKQKASSLPLAHKSGSGSIAPLQIHIFLAQLETDDLVGA
jgi:hypothetical protein